MLAPVSSLVVVVVSSLAELVDSPVVLFVSFVVAELATLDDVFFLEVVVPVLPVVPVVVPVSDSDVLSAVELCVSVEELSFDEDSSLLLSLEESELFFLLLSSLDFFLESLDDIPLTSDELVVETRDAPSLVLVTVLVTTLVAPRAKAIETIANGVINGGVRYAMLHSSLHPSY